MSTTATAPQASPETLAIGKRLVELCSAGENMKAIDELYAENVVSIEPVDCGTPGMQQVMTGIDAARSKNTWWAENHEVHSGGCCGPFPHGDRFIVGFEFDVTPKSGPMAGQRMQMKESGLFTVEGGKIVREEFFYDMGE